MFNNPAEEITFAIDVFSAGVMFGVLLAPTIPQLALFGTIEETDEYIQIVSSIDRYLSITTSYSLNGCATKSHVYLWQKTDVFWYLQWASRLVPQCLW